MMAPPGHAILEKNEEVVQANGDERVFGNVKIKNMF